MLPRAFFVLANLNSRFHATSQIGDASSKITRFGKTTMISMIYEL